MTNVQEIWLPIAGYEGLYEISNTGRVKTLSREIGTKGVTGYYFKSEKELKTEVSINGYRRVALSKKSQYKKYGVHRLVALAFIPLVCGKDLVNHKDGNRLNNHVDNLEWCTQSENAQHAYDVLGHIAPMTGKYNNIHLSTPIIQMDLNGNEINRYPSMKEAARAGFNRAHVSTCCAGIRQTHGGYKWKYS